MKNKITVSGITYESITAFCEEFGLDRQKVYAMVRRGIQYEDMIPSDEPEISADVENAVITARGKGFKSVLAFCKYYGLRYSTVAKRFNKGETGDQILDSTDIRPRRTDIESGFEYDGMTYSSLADAADALGLPAWAVYAERSGTTLEAPEVLRRVQERMKADEDHRKGCVIAGVPYKTRSAAVRAYGVSMSTVTTRMQRNGLSFEDALLQWHTERQRIYARPSRARGFVPIKACVIDPVGKFSCQVNEILTESNYSPVFYSCAPDQPEWFCCINAAADMAHTGIEVTILGSDAPKIDGFEFLIQRLWTMEGFPTARRAVLEALNECNANYAGANFWLRKNIVSASSFYPILNGVIGSRLFMRCLYRFLGASVKTVDILDRSINYAGQFIEYKL